MVQHQLHYAASDLVGGQCYYRYDYLSIHHLAPPAQTLAPADLPLAQLSKHVGKRDKLLAREDHEGQLAWLERLASAIDSRLNDDTRRHASHLTDSETR